MIWNADLYFETGYISKINPVLDFLLYGIDLIEIVSIINVGMIIYSLIRKRSSNGREKGRKRKTR